MADFILTTVKKFKDGHSEGTVLCRASHEVCEAFSATQPVFEPSDYPDDCIKYGHLVVPISILDLPVGQRWCLST